MPTLSFSIDRPGWVVVPPELVAHEGAMRRWLEERMAAFSQAWGRQLGRREQSAVRGELAGALRRFADGDSFVLQYWPTDDIVNVILRLRTGLFDGTDVVRRDPFDDVPESVLEPVLNIVETPDLGEGTEIRYVLQEGTDSAPVFVLGAKILFQNSRGYVEVDVEPTLPELVSIVSSAVNDLVHSLRVENDEEWDLATVDAAAGTAVGDDWSSVFSGGESSD